MEKGYKMMDQKVRGIRLSPSNEKKLEELKQATGLSQNQIINMALHGFTVGFVAVQTNQTQISA